MCNIRIQEHENKKKSNNNKDDYTGKCNTSQFFRMLWSDVLMVFSNVKTNANVIVGEYSI